MLREPGLETCTMLEGTAFGNAHHEEGTAGEPHTVGHGIVFGNAHHTEARILDILILGGLYRIKMLVYVPVPPIYADRRRCILESLS
jgi:hypothetical protein